jgi:hypothetical protein
VVNEYRPPTTDHASHMVPGQGLEPRPADSESAVLPLDEPGMAFVSVPEAGLEPARVAPAHFKCAVSIQLHHSGGGAPREIQTPDLPGRSRWLYSLSYGRMLWVWLRERGSNPRPRGYGPHALAAELSRTVLKGVEGESRTRMIVV